MQPFSLIHSAQVDSFLMDQLGAGAAFNLKVFNIMRLLADDQYQGGTWDLRVYPNGSFALVLPSPNEIEADAPAGPAQRCSAEAASLAASLMAFHLLYRGAEQHRALDRQRHYRRLFDALLEQLSGKVTFVIEGESIRPASEAEQAAANEPHPEFDAIYNIAC